MQVSEVRMITKLPPVGFKILQISLQIIHHFLSKLCWPLLKVHFAGHAHVKLVLDAGMWVTDWECGSLVTNYPRASPTIGDFYDECEHEFCLFGTSGMLDFVFPCYQSLIFSKL